VAAATGASVAAGAAGAAGWAPHAPSTEAPNKPRLVPAVMRRKTRLDIRLLSILISPFILTKKIDN
jgi:hypothetical protein